MGFVYRLEVDGGPEIDFLPQQEHVEAFWLRRSCLGFQSFLSLVSYLLFGLSGIRPIHFLEYISVVLTCGTAYGQKS